MGDTTSDETVFQAETSLSPAVPCPTLDLVALSVVNDQLCGVLGAAGLLRARPDKDTSCGYGRGVVALQVSPHRVGKDVEGILR